jgi:hypothetical protein
MKFIIALRVVELAEAEKSDYVFELMGDGVTTPTLWTDGAVKYIIEKIE